MRPQKIVGQYSAIQESPQFPLDKWRNRTVSFPLPPQKGLQMLRNYSVEGIFLRIPGMIGSFGIANEEILIASPKAIAAKWNLSR